MCVPSPGLTTCLPSASVSALSGTSRSCGSPYSGPAYVVPPLHPPPYRTWGQLANEDLRVGERPLLVLAAGGLVSPDARSNCPERGVERVEQVGERPVVLGLIANHDLFIKFSFVWV